MGGRHSTIRPSSRPGRSIFTRTRRRSVSTDILGIRRSLATIARALGRLTPALEAATRNAGNPSRRGRKLKLSRARRAALKLQGQYMGYLRNLKPKEKARVKALRAVKGVRAAITSAKRPAE